MFFKSILPKIGFILIYSLVIESGLEAGFPSLTEEILYHEIFSFFFQSKSAISYPTVALPY